MQRLAMESSQDGENVHLEPPRREIEFAYVRPCTPSRGRTPFRQRNSSHPRSPSRDSSARALYHERTPRPTLDHSPRRRHRHRIPSRGSPSRRSVYSERSPARVAEHAPRRYRQRSTERDQSIGKDGGWDFGGRVRHVRVSERLG